MAKYQITIGRVTVRSSSSISNCLTALLCGGCLVTALPVSAHGVDMPIGHGAQNPHCRALGNGMRSPHCYNAADSGASNNRVQQSPSDSGRWRLVRTPKPAGGPDAVAVMRTASESGSDLDFAGLMFRCQNPTIEMVLVLSRPLPPRAHPEVTISAGTTTSKFTANVVPPGALVSLPAEAAALAEESTRAEPELMISVALEHDVIHGEVSLAGLDTALQALQSSCPRQ
jgi:hypothetical protein